MIAREYRLFDGLRALAVAAVIWSHWLPAHWQFGIPWGRVGVQVFFALSGFLITGLLLRAAARAAPSWPARLRVIGNFSARRFLRIFPIYYLSLALCVLIGEPEVSRDIGWHLVYLSNVLFGLENRWGGAGSHLWTLAVEEQFYLLWPWLVLGLAAAARRTAIVAVVAVCAAGLVALPALKDPADWFFATLLPVPAFLGLAIGALLAIYHHAQPGMPRLRPWHLAVAATVWLALHHGSTAGDAPAPVLGLAHAALVVACALCVALAARGDGSGPLGRVLGFPPVAYVGMISYGVYLYHGIAPALIDRLIDAALLPPQARWGWLALGLKSSLTLAMAVLSWHLIERPLMALKSRFAYAPEASGAAPAAGHGALAPSGK